MKIELRKEDVNYLKRSFFIDTETLITTAVC